MTSEVTSLLCCAGLGRRLVLDPTEVAARKANLSSSKPKRPDVKLEKAKKFK